ncbi:MAG: RNA 3'-phosphate cyclase [Deltaproteobacteria bacterium]|nr:RNA 3'-phosphate cyclase [Deltaproteobacteria bacterium]
MMEIDGSQKSGSGTIVRDAVPFSILLGKDLRITNIRAKRMKPGLRAQHLKALEAATQLCRGQVTGAEIGSKEITVTPGDCIHGGTFRWDIGTAGSATMVASCIMLLALYADKPSVYKITGGLFQDFAPSVYHMQYVLLPLLKKMGAELAVRIIRPGYVPKGGGLIEVTGIPMMSALTPLALLDRGTVKKVLGIALSSLLAERKVSERMASACRETLRGKGYLPPIDILYDTKEKPIFDKASAQPGASLAVWAETDTGCLLGSDMAGARGRPAEVIGTKVAKQLSEDLDTTATVDRHLADQLIPFAALADGWSTYVIPRMTEHIETRLWLAETILGAQTTVTHNVIKIKGIGYRRKQ